jgi:hypothetical protein
MTVEQLVPAAAAVDLDSVLARMGGSEAHRLAPFAQPVMEFCAALSRVLFRDRDARRFPELQALAFAVRQAELVRLEREFRLLETPDTLLAPRGLVFHVPPANVDTMFVYSWLVSVLMGNRNVIRIPASAGPQTAIVCRLFNAALDECDGELRENTCMLRYGHEREITAAISSVADVRIIWGGDETVKTIRAIPIGPLCKEVTFPDRYSFAAIDARKYLALDDLARVRIAEQFYNDTFWFDQMACSSPRLVVWCGEVADARPAGTSFFSHLQEQVSRKGYSPDAGARLNKFTFACRAILDQNVADYAEWGSAITVLCLEEKHLLSREHCGGGLLFQVYQPTLQDLIPLILRRDQTLTYFGFDQAELREFAVALNGRGVDRFVPIGQALNFEHHWDGYNLFLELTRQIVIRI